MSNNVVGTVDVSQPSGKSSALITQGYVRFYNQSIYGLQVTLGDGGTYYVPPQARRLIHLDQAAGNFAWERILTLATNPGLAVSTDMIIETLDPADPLIESDLAALGGVGNLGNTGGISVSQLNGYFDVTANGAKGDGVTDNTVAIQATIDQAAVAGGVVFFPDGVFMSGPLTLKSFVHFLGCGIQSTILRLLPNANADLLSANVGDINLSAAFGTGSTGGITNWGIQMMTIDGNKAAQSAGPSYCLRAYGYAYIIENVNILNGFTDCVLMDWNGGINAPDYFVNNLETLWHNVKIHDANGVALRYGGPHDSIFSNMLCYDTGSHNAHFAPNAGPVQVSNSHFYSSAHATNSVAILCEATQSIFVNCQAEGSDVVQVAFLDVGMRWTGGRVFAVSQPASAFQIGQQAGLTPYAGQINQSAGLTTAKPSTGYAIVGVQCGLNEGSNGTIWFANDAGGTVIAEVNNATGTFTTGGRSTETTVLINGHGLTSLGTLATAGGLITGRGGRFQSGAVGWFMSTGVQALNNGNTILILGLGMVRVSSAANVTGIIINSGSYDGQTILITNETNFTITFDVAATSHVADGATSAIPGLSQRLFSWDTTTSRWYRAA